MGDVWHREFRRFLPLPVMDPSTQPTVTVPEAQLTGEPSSPEPTAGTAASEQSASDASGQTPAGSTTRFLRTRWWNRLASRWWFAPAVLLLIGAVLGWSHFQVLQSLKSKLASDLQTILEADRTALDVWLDSRRQSVRNIVAEPRTQELVAQIYRANRTGLLEPDELAVLPELALLRQHLRPMLRSHGFLGFTVVDVHYQIIASETDDPVGTSLQPALYDFVDITKQGRTLVTPPFRSTFSFGESQQAGAPVMYAATPVHDPVTGEVIATFALRLQPLGELAHILEVARPGESGDVYLFSRNGVMLTQSRFEDQLRDIGLLKPGQSSMLAVQLRNPGVNLVRGQTTDIRVAARPLTWLADKATAHVVDSEIGDPDAESHAGINVDGYRDYRGVMVVGAWRWLPESGMGIALEMNVDEAWKDMLHPLKVLWLVFGLVLVFVAVSLISYRMNTRLRSKIGEVRQEIRQLGQYRLEKLLGEGGMGAVYQASHALLRRPTAIKLIRTHRVSHEAVRRFEREVQLTARLTHPNTIAIFDYGRTPDGIFYYAMELLPGLTLQQLVTKFGPLPPARVVHILEQVCGSLAEAHSVGLIHRDIKPGNIMLCSRGVPDLAKVLDFGLVKDVAGHHETGDQPLTQHNRVVGTPLYMSPQQLLAPDTVDAQADLWSVGAVGYFLLAGQPPMKGHGVMEVISEHMQRRTPEPPSRRVEGLDVPAELEQLILACLHHEPDQRPAGMTGLLDALEQLPLHGQWTRRDAHGWWTAHAPEMLQLPTADKPPSSGAISESMAIDLGRRRKPSDPTPPPPSSGDGAAGDAGTAGSASDAGDAPQAEPHDRPAKGTATDE